MSDQPKSAVETEVRSEEGQGVVILRGRLDLESTGDCWRDLEQRVPRLGVGSLKVDISHLEIQGGAGVALLRYLCEGGMTPGARVSLEGVGAEQEKILETFTAQDFRAYRPEKPRSAGVVEEVGEAFRGLWQDVREQIEFVGAVMRLLPGTLFYPKRLRIREIKRVVETAGANALPVVGIFSWLVGLVLALEAAHPLAQFGAQLFIADMVGFSSVRDTGPLIMAILLAGRSSSAFAAELGTMKVNQELDALTTMGLNPVQFLVVQRIIGTLLLAPLLAMYAMLLAIVGGITFLRFLGFPPLMIYHQITGRVHVRDFGVGLVKSLVFGLIVGAVGCLRGLQTAQGPRAVGVSTTRSVVASILLIVAANTLVSMVAYFLGI